jgi:DNA replication protein DnaC
MIPPRIRSRQMTHNLKELLIRLKLPSMAARYDEVSKTASEKNLSYREYLQILAEEEIAGKLERMVSTRIRQAKFPVVKTLDTFNFQFPKRINKKSILRLCDLEFIQRKENAIFLGPSGCGKTHLALALGYSACQTGLRVLFTTAVNLINNLNASFADASFLQCMKRYIRPELVIIDELGYLPIDKKGADLLFQVITARYECGSIVLTTNLPFKDWARIFNDDSSLASAAADRLVHHAEVITIEGESYRVSTRTKKTL